MTYNPEQFWQKRLEDKFSLAGVGLRRRGESFNRWVYKARLDRLKTTLLKHGIDAKGKRILDIGCGTGFYVDFWHNLGPSFIMGIDITRKSVEELHRRYPQYTFEQTDISQPCPYSGEAFDIITAFDVLFHVVNEAGFETAIANIRTYANDGAFVLLTDVFGRQDISVQQHYFSRSYQRYRKVLKANGLDILAVYPQLFLLNPPIDVSNRYLSYILLSLWSLLTYPTLIEPIGQFLGALLYAIDDRMSQGLSGNLSTKIMVCRTYNAG